MAKQKEEKKQEPVIENKTSFKTAKNNSSDVAVKSGETGIERKVKTQRIKSEVKKIQWASKSKANRNFAITIATITVFAVVFFILSIIFLHAIGLLSGITLGI